MALGVLAVASATACSHNGHKTFADRSEIPTGTPTWLLGQAHSMATKGLGDPHPQHLRIRLGNVYVIEEWGDFTCLLCSYPPGGSAPKGTHAILRVNPQTRKEISFALS